MTDAGLEWQPSQEAHSIEVVSAAVNFSEALTEVAWKKVVRDAEGVCRAAGLLEKSAVNTVQIMIGTSPEAAPPQAIDGMLFMRSQAVNVPGGGIQRKALEALSVNRTGLNFQSTVYSRWDAFFERLKLMVRPPLRGALRSVGVLNLRLEYRDGFRFVGKGQPLAMTLLNEKSDLIAPHVFRNERLWHSHTGFFEDAPGCKERLVQINVDANIAHQLGRLDDPFRTVTISTAAQNNLDPASAETLDNEEELANSQMSMFDSLHIRSIELFKNIVSPEMASRVGIQ
jgi:hypothetical protein